MGQAEDPNRSLNVVITGDAGLIGGVLMPYLTAMGHTVRRLTRQGADPTWSDLISRPAEGALDPSHFDGGPPWATWPTAQPRASVDTPQPR